MARMFPSPMRPDTSSNAERKLYAACEDQLPSEFCVFHSVSWQVRDTRAGVRDGEADFVIAHPDYGILILEAKGGRIRYDGRAAQWYSNQHPIKDPFQQGRDNKYSLLEKLKEIPYWRNRWVTVGYATALPDVIVEAALRLDAPRELVLDASDLADVSGWVKRALSFLRGRRPDDNPLGETGIRELISLLSPSWDLHLPPLGRNPGRETGTGTTDGRAVHHVELPGTPPASRHQRLCWLRQDDAGRRESKAARGARLSRVVDLF